MAVDLGEDSYWRRCEVAWSNWLLSDGYLVVRLGEAEGNTSTSSAPLIGFGANQMRSPDFQASKAGKSVFWEVKFRTRSDIDPLTGERSHWMEYAAFSDYLQTAMSGGTKLWIALYEAPTAIAEGRWLRAEIREIRDSGRQTQRFGQAGEELVAFSWPVSIMTVINGPAVPRPGDVGASDPILPSEGSGEALRVSDFAPVERSLRSRLPDVEAASDSPPRDDAGVRAARVLNSDLAAGLDVLRQSLAVPAMPSYSVMWVGNGDPGWDEALGFLRYGIRLFVITPERVSHTMEPDEFQAFRDSRLLEIAEVPAAHNVEGRWIVDGHLSADVEVEIRDVLDAADESGQVNIGQYRIVHAAADANVLVMAGAGTGKTETMAERIAFLLATSTAGAADPGATELRADDIALMTFTREAAREMRHRVTRTLLLRRRMASRCVHPVIGWLMQLATAEIGTIHSFARTIASTGAGAVGIGPDVAVSRLTLDFRAYLNDSISQDVTALIANFPKEQVPAIHEWQDHLRNIWDALENNGVPVIAYAAGDHLEDVVDLGDRQGESLEALVAHATRASLINLSQAMSTHAIREQVVTTGQLVPMALASLTVQANPPVRRPRYLFVDEFQDTDSTQMDLVLEVGERLGARLFVVGDSKQGIYRFRGAEGNAFREFTDRVARRDIGPLLKFSLTTNFRTGRALLDSLHPVFKSLGDASLLSYEADDRLRPVDRGTDLSAPFERMPVKANQIASRAAQLAIDWRSAASSESVAILCRENWQALQVQTAIRQGGGTCELLVGGWFYTSPAVRELRVLLEAVTQPSDDAAALELCETRWGAGLLNAECPRGISTNSWGGPVRSPLNWLSRLLELPATGNLARVDLEPVRARLRLLLEMSRRMPALAWIIECSHALVPEASTMPGPDDETERLRYAVCFDHLVTLMDLQFRDRPVTLERLLAWLRLQIATNRNEDEPVGTDRLKTSTTALTVHKAKGLEFDRVLLPFMSTPFGPPRSAKSRTAIVRSTGEKPRLLWEWKSSRVFSNVAADQTQLWADDARETAREESRLLYVALTRARSKLLVLEPDRAWSNASGPNSWLDLLKLGHS